MRAVGMLLMSRSCRPSRSDVLRCSRQQAPTWRGDEGDHSSKRLWSDRIKMRAVRKP
jgi:hypothetical protein